MRGGPFPLSAQDYRGVATGGTNPPWGQGPGSASPRGAFNSAGCADVAPDRCELGPAGESTAKSTRPAV